MAGPEHNPLTRNWLVKSSTKILGPFTREEVLELLTRRQITIIDEIRQPEGRWNYIRENRHFKEIVKNLRYEDDHSREDTMTSTMTSTASQNAQTAITKTDPGAEEESSLSTTPSVPPRAPPGKSSAPQKPTIKDVTPKASSAQNATKASALQTAATKSFGNLQDQRVQSKIQKQNVFLRVLLIGFVICIAVFLSYNYIRKDKRSDQGYSQLIASALKYKELGLFEKALENYKRAAAIKEPDLASQFQMVFLLINQDRQSVIGRRIAERAALKEGRPRSEVIQGHLGMALSYMMEGDFGQAEDYFQKVLSVDPNNLSAKFNQATILFKKGNYSQALTAYQSISSAGNLMYPLVLLYRAMAMIEITKTTTAGASGPAVAPADFELVNAENQQKLTQEMRVFTQKSHFLRKEVALLWGYLEGLAHNPEGKKEAAEIFLGEPYNFSALFVKDPTLDWRNAEWDYLEKYCAELYEADTASAGMKAVRAVCLLESNRDMEATKFIDESIAADPKQPSSLEAQAVYLWKLGRLNEAKSLLQNSDIKDSRLSLYIQGEACSKAKDIPCAETAYRDLEKKDVTDVMPPYGLARLKAEQKDKVQALGLIKTGLEREKNFIPLIELRDKLESL